jgi:hypothetical protein
LTQIKRAMKPAFSYLLSIVVLLCMAWGCEEPAVYKPKPLPPTLVPNPKTPPAIEPIYCPGFSTSQCSGTHGDLIARINIWTTNSPNPWAMTACELIDSTATELHLETQQVFRYDQQGRIVGETLITTSIDTDKRSVKTDTAVLRYTYFPNYVLRKGTGTYFGKPVPEDYEVRTELNENGYTTKGTRGYRPTFDKDGYLISAVSSYAGPFVVRNGNVILSSAEALEGSGEIRATFIYDTTRANIPNPYQFEGRDSRNLRIREIVSVGGPGTVPFVTAAVTNYQYQFDRQGAVSRRTKFGKSNNLRAWPYVVSTTVTEYFYDCR